MKPQRQNEPVLDDSSPLCSHLKPVRWSRTEAARLLHHRLQALEVGAVADRLAGVGEQGPHALDLPDGVVALALSRRRRRAHVHQAVDGVGHLCAGGGADVSGAPHWHSHLLNIREQPQY